MVPGWLSGCLPGLMVGCLAGSLAGWLSGGLSGLDAWPQPQNPGPKLEAWGSLDFDQGMLGYLVLHLLALKKD